MSRRLRFAAALLALAVLSACAPRPVRPPEAAGDRIQLLAAQSAREAMLADAPDWSLAGRLAVSVAGEGGSGRIDWRQRGPALEIRLSAPVTRQSWVLAAAPGRARIDGLPDGPREGGDAEALLHEATGWTVPLSALSAWVRGARAPGPAEIEFGPDGLPVLIRQDGWTVEYRAWDGGEPARPLRVFARRGEASVRLVVDAWGAP